MGRLDRASAAIANALRILPSCGEPGFQSPGTLASGLSVILRARLSPIERLTLASAACLALDHEELDTLMTAAQHHRAPFARGGWHPRGYPETGRNRAMTTSETQAAVAEFNDYFGLCPDCHAAPSYRNVNRTHVAHCEKCRVKWIIGANLFSCWRGESEADWKANANFLADFREVEPYFTSDDGVAAHDRKHRDLIGEGIQIVCGNGGFFVVAVPGKFADIGGDPVDVIYGPLETREAADCARTDVILNIEDAGHYYGPSEVPSEHWNAHGRVLLFLRDREGKTPKELALELMQMTPWGPQARPQPGNNMDMEIPF